MNYKLKIELVPQSSFYNNIRNEVSKQIWDIIRKSTYKKAGYECEVCGTEGVLHCHEIWSYDDEEKIQTLKGFQALCENCHMLKHIGFSMHTEKGKEKFDREELINHFCEINDCTREDFMEYEEKVFKQWRKRSEYEWVVDLQEYEIYLL